VDGVSIWGSTAWTVSVSGAVQRGRCQYLGQHNVVLTVSGAVERGRCQYLGQWNVDDVSIWDSKTWILSVSETVQRGRCQYLR
jgi:hypothetical protein